MVQMVKKMTRMISVMVAKMMKTALVSGMIFWSLSVFQKMLETMLRMLVPCGYLEAVAETMSCSILPWTTPLHSSGW